MVCLYRGPLINCIKLQEVLMEHFQLCVTKTESCHLPVDLTALTAVLVGIFYIHAVGFRQQILAVI